MENSAPHIPRKSQLNKTKAQWFVMRSLKKEMQAEQRLLEAGLQCYVPKHYIVQVIHGKKTRRLVPYITSLVFVHASQERIIAFKEKYNSLQFVVWKKSTGAEYLVVPDRQMEDFIRISSSQQETVTYFRPCEINLAKGTRVRVLGGELDGVEGIFVKVKGKRSRQVVSIIPDIMAVSVEVAPDLIEVLPPIEKTIHS